MSVTQLNDAVRYHYNLAMWMTLALLERRFDHIYTHRFKINRILTGLPFFSIDRLLSFSLTKNGRILNTTVSPTNKIDTLRLLNYLSAPHVLYRVRQQLRHLYQEFSKLLVFW